MPDNLVILFNSMLKQIESISGECIFRLEMNIDKNVFDLHIMKKQNELTEQKTILWSDTFKWLDSLDSKINFIAIEPIIWINSTNELGIKLSFSFND